MPPPGVCLNIMEARQKQEGYGSLLNPSLLFSQDYQQLKEFCVTQRVKFIDDMFPPDRKSIGQGILSPADLARVVWLRPAKISQNPSFVLHGFSRFDFGQGALGNCWFLASIGALTFQDHIFRQVVPAKQGFDENYCGLFHFMFWRFGKWVDVVIDDKLPTINGRLVFVQSKNQTEFWPALLEKAYAKVCGSYTDMNVGTPAEAMVDFTGGVHICIQLSDPPPDLWELMSRAANFGALLGCSTPQEETSSSTSSPNGLVHGHAYTVTGVIQLMSRRKPVKMVRLWNPWGKGEWNGDWSDRSSLWQTVSSQDWEKCLSVAEDGEFWMTLVDFCKFYTDLDICGLNPNFLDEDSCHWRTSMVEGRWVAGTTAGGCMNYKDTFWTNPQFRVKVCGESSKRKAEKNMLVSLMQKPDKRNRHLVQNLYIGFSIFEMKEQYLSHRGKFTASFFSSQTPVAQTKTFMNAREVMEFLTLKPGEYMIIPSTFHPNETASFILTILCKTETHCYDNSCAISPEPVQKPMKVKNRQEDENKATFFCQYSDKYEEVDAEQLQRILNKSLLKEDLKSGGFSIDACRSMVALMDTSITGKLNSEEFIRLWNKVVIYKTDVSRTGTLSLTELRNAFVASGMRVSDDMLNLMALRYGASSGHMTLESFISLILRLECMFKIFRRLSDGKTMTLQESEWIYVSMYT
ncbi:calpain-8-like isoform X3 [Girardinichthys multiradiatus]|uniref:calpain-8-like isoform X3 n=1 Tax=Girardinichthys multiradiatus TaxID=208333 RepID=UPI001FACFC4D|nr:calpain-8-like isoform X3 [Girardinichthys multiradiatus]